MKLNHEIIADAFDSKTYNPRSTKYAMSKHPIRSFIGTFHPIFRDVFIHKNIDPSFVMTYVSTNYRVSIDDIKGRSRKKHIVCARQTVCWLLKKLSDLSLSEVGAVVGGIDHATVIHSCKAIDNYIFCKDTIGVNAKILLNQLQ